MTMIHFFYIAVFIILYSIFLWETNEMREDIETLRKEYAKLLGDIYGSNERILKEWKETINRFNYFQEELLSCLDKVVKGNDGSNN